MCKRWKKILLPFLLLLFLQLWLLEKGLDDLEYTSHAEHELFAVRIDADAREEREIECWQNPYEEGYYLFLPAYVFQRDCFFCLNQGDKLVIEGKEIKDGDSLGGLSRNQEYEFALYHGDSLQNQGKVVVMQSAELAALFVDTESGDMEAINQDKEYEEGGTYSLVAADGEKKVSGELEYITGRGNSTWEWGKKPYRIKLQREEDLLDMGAGKSWELLANFYDGSYIRNKIVYDLADDIGLSYSPQSEFVDLYLNGYYAGLYQLSEKVEIGKERVNIADLSKENKKRNNKVENYDVFEKENERGVLLERQPQDITGGYLMEWDVDFRYYSASSSFVTKQGQTVMIKDPAKSSQEEVAYIHQIVQGFEDALYTEDGINPYTGKSLGEYIDMESWAKKYLIEELSKNFDGGISSQYFYKDSDLRGDSLLYAGPVWDYDGALGNGDWSVRRPEGMLVCYDMRIYDREKGDEVFRNRWFPELYRHKEFREEVERQYQVSLWPALYEMLETGIDHYWTTIETAAEMDQCRWEGEPSSVQKVYRDTLEEHAEYIKDFLKRRAVFLASVWIDKVDYCTVCFRTEYGTRNLFFSVERGSLLEKIPGYEESFGGMVFDGWYYDEDYTQPLDPQRVITEDIDFYAKWIQEG
ncbi:MAG: hypothetical protein HFI23_01055 [Lachnospiraceae bacterium]|nr:hypothetical protein [Lachnospiraceae bacterium]